eukprot:TRINITY_DN21890_c0_g1_i1.p1 TRINITY_DN21890_c0_g1~~TRINITY_DN21890_c0_g1_i1.p1  ORF type:complete len:393 (-),score=61.02 TRINITY_DN21890_c0_g1_i1:695-1873(-)
MATPATLVLCPSDVAQQWVDEIGSCVDMDKAKLAVIKIATVSELQNHTYQDFLTSDIVIVSFELLQDSNYQKKRHNCESSPCKRDECLLNASRSIQTQYDTWLANGKKNSGSPLLAKAPLIEQFHWYRIILHEDYECNTPHCCSTLWPSLTARTKWYVTGSPFPSGMCAFEALMKDYLEIQYVKDGEPPNHDITFTNDVQLSMIKSSLSSFFLRRRAELHNLPKLPEELILMKQPPIERALYKLAERQKVGDLMLRKICCHPLVSPFIQNLISKDQTDISKIKQEIIANGNDLISFTEKQIAQDVTNLAALRAQIATAQNLFVETQAESAAVVKEGDEITRLRNGVSELTKRIAKAEATIRTTKQYTKLFLDLNEKNDLNEEKHAEYDLSGR